MNTYFYFCKYHSYYMHATRNVYQTCTTKVVEYFLTLTKAIQGSIIFINVLSKFSSIIL